MKGVILVEDKKLICEDCHEEFELTPEGKHICRDYNFPAPTHCRQCSIIRDAKIGYDVRDYSKVKTDSKYWTPERKAAYEASLSQSANNGQARVKK